MRPLHPLQTIRAAKAGNSLSSSFPRSHTQPFNAKGITRGSFFIAGSFSHQISHQFGFQPKELKRMGSQWQVQLPRQAQEPEESAHVATPAQAAPERSEMDCAVTCASHSRVPPSRAHVLLCIMPGLGISSTSEITGNAHSSPLQGMPGPALFNLLL